MCNRQGMAMRGLLRLALDHLGGTRADRGANELKGFARLAIIQIRQGKLNSFQYLDRKAPIFGGETPRTSVPVQSKAGRSREKSMASRVHRCPPWDRSRGQDGGP